MKYISRCGAYENEVNEVAFNSPMIFPPFSFAVMLRFEAARSAHTLSHHTAYLRYPVSPPAIAHGEHYFDTPQDCDLRNIAVNPQSAPLIDFVLVPGMHQPGTAQACQHFATDFKLYYLDVPAYLTELCDVSNLEREEYGFLDPSVYG